MRLLNAKTLKLEEFVGHEIPKYAILSHTWGKDEVSFQDMQTSTVTERKGYAKIEHSCERALQECIYYVWVDTCCIDKTNSVELSEAINSMMAWYAQSEVCYAYLADVPPTFDDEACKTAFCQSRWFTRGWTLQELIAPSRLTFLAQDWSFLFRRERVAHLIGKVTGISRSFLEVRSHYKILDYNLISTSIAERISWASNRETTRPEDMSYCLLGILQVNMPLLYGEGTYAFRSLQQEIIKHSDDQSLFAWSFRTPDHDLSHKRPWSISQAFLQRIVSSFTDYAIPPESSGAMELDDLDISGILAESPAAFRGCGDIVPCDVKKPTPPFAMTNKGLGIELPILQLWDGCFALLQCQTKTDPTRLIAVPLRKIHDTYCRSKRGNYVADHAAWFRWPRAQIYIFPDTFATYAGLMNRPGYSVVIGSLPPNLRIVEILPSNSGRQPKSRLIFTKSVKDPKYKNNNVFVSLQDMGGSGLCFILAVRVIKPRRRYGPDGEDTVIPYLFLPPPHNDSPTFEDLEDALRHQDLATEFSIPYSINMRTQTMFRGALHIIDILPEPLGRKETGLEIHNLKYWIRLLHRALIPDPLMETAHRNWLDFLCDQGLHFLRLLALLPLFFTFPFDLSVKLFVSLTTPVVSHIISYERCLTTTSYQLRLALVVHKILRTALANTSSFAAVVSTIYLLLNNPSDLRGIYVRLMKYSRSRSIIKVFLLYMICKCIPSKTLLSLAGEEGAYHED
ncbi:HET-domain-containing protein [Aspergillus welwitschiae]|uniref:HET-domain-containing protein n=1 Tax=Aspergillus welwitschiae TaxID=1341132 RepID=A0A3F3Q2Q0_9EURO|nr:HET-domain-containing protein [Aspergillus welwitschiae]RDH32956.1 HET-domain-containing protein [Aspergillus welwitschiae]